VRRRRFLATLAPFVLSLPVSTCARELAAQAAPKPEARASTAVRLATLAERIAKLHAQIGLGVLVERSRRALAATTRDFEAGLRALTARGAAPEARETFQLLALLWQDYHPWASKPPTRENARRLGERAEEVVWVAMKGARLLQAQPRAATDALALKAAEACTLSQRIPRLHLWRRWGIRDEGMLNELRLSEVQLRATLEALAAASAQWPQIASELQLADNQAAFLAQASRQLESGREAARHLEFVAKTGDHILESLERVVRLYETHRAEIAVS
jgi:hypothetical protein